MKVSANINQKKSKFSSKQLLKQKKKEDILTSKNS